MAAPVIVTPPPEKLKSPSTLKELKNTEKRDSLIAVEKKYQQKWKADRTFEANAPTIEEVPLRSVSAADLRTKYPKYFACMAYPYMNGTLHVGHAFSVSKVEFATGAARMQGKRALFPMGFHCTGMPIKSCADKLLEEINRFGKTFSEFKEDDEADGPTATEGATEKPRKVDASKFTANKSKTNAKTIKKKYQFQILERAGIKSKDIHKFADANYWLQHFPAIAIQDLSSIGLRIDWRRSFITTDANPYYDAFVRWQMNRLRELKKIKFGKRYTIYSIKDGQPCMDHDRAEGEAITPQEYTALKLKVLEWAPEAAQHLAKKIPEKSNVFLVAATLRPETMYGQTGCFIGPALTYGVFKANATDYFVVTNRAARNMAYQGIFDKEGQISKVADIQGSTMVGSLVHAPFSFHAAGVRVLPMEAVLPTKGTGVVACVPSESPSDFATVTDLAKKAEFYGIQREWAQMEISPIIDTPSYGDLCAPYLSNMLKIASPKDTKQLEEAKALAFKEGFYQGVMKVGDFKGAKVEIAQEKVRSQLIGKGEAFAYSEPEGQVVSRSGDDCIVALLDQWYLDYGEESWKQAALKWVENADGKGMETWVPETKNGFEAVLNWLNQWACARTYGLGSKLPWDEQFLVESLSDSTIYMAYYTIAHYLHADLFGKERGLANVSPWQMTDEVWDYVFCRRELDDSVLGSSQIPQQALEEMRREFEYFYPLDMRCSGKDLVPNHLTFFLYIHLAIFPPEYWPRGVRVNGHLMMNGEKMSKSTGNMMSLEEVVRKFGADATRIALADAGDGVNDANFEEDVADASVLRLHALREWCEEMVYEQADLRQGPKNDFQDGLFENDINVLAHEAIDQYGHTNFKLALKAALYELTSARDTYRESCAAANIKMHKDLVLWYIEVQALLMSIIAPHWAEYLWLEVLKKDFSIQYARFPKVAAVDPGLSVKRAYVRSTTSTINATVALQTRKKAKGKNLSFDPSKPTQLNIYLSETFPAWQEQCIDLLDELWDSNTKSVNEKALSYRAAQLGEVKKAMPFVQNLKRRLQGGEPKAVVLRQQLMFNEKETLLQMIPGLQRTVGLASCEIWVVEGGMTATRVSDGQSTVVSRSIAENTIPGSPAYLLQNTVIEA